MPKSLEYNTTVTKAPSEFMNIMNDVLSNYLDDFVLVFLDDIWVFPHSGDTH